jgi:hypothetical protein
MDAMFNNTTGAQNTAAGGSALYSNTTGDNNTASGYASLLSNTTGSGNTAAGYQALYTTTTSINNAVFGFNAGRDITNGSTNSALGTYALLNATTGSGNVCLGSLTSGNSYLPVFNVTTENDRVVMGSTTVTNAYIQVAWTVVSDARDKTNFAPVPHGLDFVTKLKPVAYQFKISRESEETNGPVRYGFKAQDILELEGADSVIVDSTDPEKLRFNDQHLVAVLVKAVQELKSELDLVKYELSTLKGN